MSATPERTLANPEPLIADLQRQLAEREAELAEAQRDLNETMTQRDEALAREAATAEVLQVINSCPGDLAPVFDAMLDKAMRLCEASFGVMHKYDRGSFYPLALRGVPAAYSELLLREPLKFGPDTALGRIEAGEDVISSTDAAVDYRQASSLIKSSAVSAAWSLYRCARMELFSVFWSPIAKNLGHSPTSRSFCCRTSRRRQ